MGKTVTSILAIGAAIAVNAVPGIGTAISGAIFTTLGGGAAAASIAIASTYVLTTALTAYGVSSAASVLGLGPSLPKPETTETSIKTARPPRVAAYGTSRLYGASALYETASNGTAVDIWAVHDGKLDTILAYYLADETVTLTGNVVNEGTDGRYKGGAVSLYVTNGATPGAGFPAVTALIPAWSGRGDGVVAIARLAKAVKGKDFQETYPQSTPPEASIAAKWQRCPDPANADPTNQAAWTWTEDPVRQLLHYMLVREGVDYAKKIQPAIASWIAASADCVAARALKAGGSEAKYRSCVSHKLTDKHDAVKGTILNTFDGWMMPRSDGAWVIYSGVFTEPTVSIGSAEIVSYAWDGAGIDDDQAVNELICSYVSALHDYNMVECDAWRDESDITDRGQVLSDNLALQVPSHAQVRYLAKRKMARVMAPNRGSVTTNVAGRIVRGQRYIDLHIEEAGTVFFSGVAEITSLSRNVATGGVTFGWVEFNPDVDSWNPATEEGEPAAKGTRTASVALAAPTIDAVTVIDGPRLDIDATGPDRDDLTWFARVRQDGATVWGTDLEYSDTGTGGPTVSIITDVVPTGDLEVQVAYAIGDGRVSPYSTIATASVDSEVIYDGGDASGDLT